MGRGKQNTHTHPDKHVHIVRYWRINSLGYVALALAYLQREREKRHVGIHRETCIAFIISVHAIFAHGAAAGASGALEIAASFRFKTLVIQFTHACLGFNEITHCRSNVQNENIYLYVLVYMKCDSNKVSAPRINAMSTGHMQTERCEAVPGHRTLCPRRVVRRSSWLATHTWAAAVRRRCVCVAVHIWAD